ncbi:hypothetical protein [Emcibacter sp.]|uniref:hypothetical protein n=1 Tax=Emcibacter sp. TaxID=1979954 RepID=UPI002AA62786|nr:hypothetical protein [Emcibacter sp.]
MRKIPDASIQHLIEAEQLPPDFGETVDRYYRPVALRIAELHKDLDRSLVIGLNGAQGSGKSTMAAFLKLLLEHSYDLSTAVLSIDDLYLTRTEREALSRQVHPLLVTRGVPGTHDIDLGIRTINNLAQAREGEITSIPRFDKSRDDRRPESDWDSWEGPAQVVILEGWCVGARPQNDQDLNTPVNELERFEDPEGTWRHYANDELRTHYQDLFNMLDYLIMLKVQSFECVQSFRLKQEQKLARKIAEADGPTKGTRLMDEAAVKRFIMHYERLTRFMLETMPAYANIILHVDSDHRITGPLHFG